VLGELVLGEPAPGEPELRPSTKLGLRLFPYFCGSFGLIVCIKNQTSSLLIGNAVLHPFSFFYLAFNFKHHPPQDSEFSEIRKFWIFFLLSPKISS
jgi:hypothetical protein